MAIYPITSWLLPWAACNSRHCCDEPFRKRKPRIKNITVKWSDSKLAFQKAGNINVARNTEGSVRADKRKLFGHLNHVKWHSNITILILCRTKMSKQSMQQITGRESVSDNHTGWKPSTFLLQLNFEIIPYKIHKNWWHEIWRLGLLERKEICEAPINLSSCTYEFEEHEHFRVNQTKIVTNYQFEEAVA